MTGTPRDRRVRELSFAELRAAESRHHVIQHDRVRRAGVAPAKLLDPHERVQAVLRRRHADPIGFEDEPKHLACIVVVLDEQDLQRRRRRHKLASGALARWRTNSRAAAMSVSSWQGFVSTASA